MIVYISIGNSDDKLSQAEWASYREHVDLAIRRYAAHVHGAWVSPSADPWQNACWCIEISLDQALPLGRTLARYAGEYRQDSIAWATANTEFIKPEDARA